MSTPQNNDSQFLAYRYARMKNSPNNWLFWIALFSALNGIFLVTAQKMVLSAALVTPSLFNGAVPHFVAAALLVALAVAGRRKVPVLTYVGLVIYLLDTVYAALSGLNSAVIMHAIVLAFVGFTILRAKSLAKQLAELPPIPDPFPK